jgi:hypothetical protein
MSAGCGCTRTQRCTHHLAAEADNRSLREVVLGLTLEDFPSEGKTDWDWICSHCSRDMRQKPQETCSNGGLCISIAELNERRLHATQREGELTNDLLKQFIDGMFSEDLKHRGQELCRELLAARQRIDNLQLSYNMVTGNRLRYNR